MKVAPHSPMRIFSPAGFLIALVTSMAYVLGTLFIPQAATGEQLKTEMLHFGKPFPFISQNFSRLDAPPGYVGNFTVSSPWEYGISGNLTMFLAILVLVFIVLFPLLRICEWIYRRAR